MTGTLGPGLGYGRAARFMYIATAAQTTFSGADSSTEALTLSYTPNFVEVVVNGLWLPPTDYTATNGSSVVFASGLIAGDIVYVYVLSVLAMADAVSFAGVQSLTSGQKIQARQNVDAVGRVRVQTFAASGTYTPSTGMLYCTIECFGGGGGGGGVAGHANYYFCAGGGGAGGYSRKHASASDVGVSQVVTIGASGAGGAAGANTGSSGGNTSVGSLCIANGGGGGTYSSTAAIGSGGTGGTAGTGDITARGEPGMGGSYSNSVVGGLNIQTNSGTGGSTMLGGAGTHSSGAAAANSGGGGGGANVGASATNTAGGAGGSGYVIITEFCEQ